jgi:2-amino-4-hydroxy-6-hydroxymethyldihydropteridine diphosphokinase
MNMQDLMSLTDAYIALGSNLGDRAATLDAALSRLQEPPEITLISWSRFYETAPVGGPPGQGPFLNAAARLETTLDPHQLMGVLRSVEREFHRVRGERWGERTLDLDLLMHGSTFLDTEELSLPHPRMALRPFVLRPLAEIAPNLVDVVTGRTVADLLARLDQPSRIIALDGPAGPALEEVLARLMEALPAIGVRRFEQDPTFPHEMGETRYLVPESLKPFRLDRSLDSHWFVVERWDESDPIQPAAEPCETLFRLILPSVPRTRRCPGFSRTPCLWPESDDPEAVVAEAVATARGIFAGPAIAKDG